MEEEKEAPLFQHPTEPIKQQTKIEEEKEEKKPKYFNNMKKIKYTFEKKLSSFAGKQLFWCCVILFRKAFCRKQVFNHKKSGLFG